MLINNQHDCISYYSLKQEKYDAAIEKYRSDKRKLSRQCEKLEGELKSKESELTSAKQAAEQLQGAFANFQLTANKVY